jgi:hypothetical protein
MYCLIRKARRATTELHEEGDEIRCALVNDKLNLCCGRLLEVREVKCFKAALTNDEITFHDWGRVKGEASPSTSDSSLFTSVLSSSTR